MSVHAGGVAYTRVWHRARVRGACVCGWHGAMCVCTPGVRLQVLVCRILEDSAEVSGKPALRALQTGPGYLLSRAHPCWDTLAVSPVGISEAGIPGPVWMELSVAVLGLRTEHRVLSSLGQKAER